jgi:hypothetical protein
MRKIIMTGIVLVTLAFSMIPTSCTSKKPGIDTGTDKGSEINQPSTAPTITPTASPGSDSVGITITLGSQEFNLDKEFDEKALEKLNADELSILRNSIYAKYGYIFSSQKLKDYFAQFTWYKPASKNVESKLNKVDRQNVEKIQALEEVKNLHMMDYYKNGKSYNVTQTGNIVFSYKNRQETLYIESQEIVSDEDFQNCPARVKLKIGSSEVTYEDMFNDGIFVNAADFDESDSYMDILITHQNTDVEAHTTIYRYDGTNLKEYSSFDHDSEGFKYDGKGKIYCSFASDYSYDTDFDVVYNTCFDYKTRKLGPITDKDLLKLLNSDEQPQT